MVDHLEAHARSTGEVPPELEQLAAGAPVGTESLWSCFLALNAGRGSNGFGPSPLSLANIQAYATLYGVAFTPWELDVLLDLDIVVLKTLSKKGGSDGV